MVGDVATLPGRAAVTRERPQRTLTWPLRGLLAASLAVPLLLLAIAAWQNLRLVQRQADERVSIEARELRGHRLHAQKTYRIVLGWRHARAPRLVLDRT